MNNKFKFKAFLPIVIFISFALTISCSTPSENNTSKVNKEIETIKKDKQDLSKTKQTDSLTKADSKTSEKDDPPYKDLKKLRVAKKVCESVNVGDNMILKNQTFPIDFKPFEGSCFVTSHNAEYDDPPLGSEFAIYKDGKKIYEFDTRFHSDAATCWIEAVAFDDLNDDKLFDIIIVGKCGAKSGDIQGNEVFANNGKGFDTNVKGNDELENFKTVKEISNFVKKNQKLFFK